MGIAAGLLCGLLGLTALIAVGIALSAGTLWIACRILREPRDFSSCIIYFVFTPLSIVSGPLGLGARFAPMDQMEMKLVLLGAAVVVGIWAGVDLISERLGLSYPKAAGAVLIQMLLTVPICCILILPAVGFPSVQQITQMVIDARAQREAKRRAELPPPPPPTSLQPAEVPPNDPPQPAEDPTLPTPPAESTASGFAPPVRETHSPLTRPTVSSNPYQPAPGASGRTGLFGPSASGGTDPASGSPLGLSPSLPANGESALPATGTPIPPPQPVEPQFAPGLAGTAQRSFYRGRLDDALAFLRAAALASDDSPLWDDMQYYPGLKRPSPGVRWGLVVQRSGGDQAIGVLFGGNQAHEISPAQLGELTGEIGPRLFQLLPANRLARHLQSPDRRDPPTADQPHLLPVQQDLPSALNAARQRALDALAVIQLTYRIQKSSGLQDTILAVRLLDMESGEVIWSSNSLSSIQVKAALGRGQNPVQDLLTHAKTALAEQMAPVSQPSLDRQQVAQRVQQIATQVTLDPLAVLLEIRYYQRAGILAEKDAVAACQKLLGMKEGAQLLAGNEAQREAALERILPRSGRQ